MPSISRAQSVEGLRSDVNFLVQVVNTQSEAIRAAVFTFGFKVSFFSVGLRVEAVGQGFRLIQINGYFVTSSKALPYASLNLSTEF